jgi:AAA family ATP:ADP antiporter
VPALISQFRFTPYSLMVAGAVLLLMALVLTLLVNRRPHGVVDPLAPQIEATPLGKEGALELILKDRYLIWIATLTVLLNVVNTTGEFLLSGLVRDAASSLATPAERQQYVASFYGSFFGVVNLVGFLVQLLVTSRVMRFMGVRGALFILPVLAFANYAVIAVVPLLAVVRIGKILENSTDYSIQNTVRQALYLPTSRETKYKAKAAIDTFFTRLGDVVAAGVATAGTAVGLGLGGFAWFNVVLTGVWLFVAGRISREHRRKTV